MRKLGLSAACVVLVASPVWAVYPPVGAGSVPPPAGYPAVGYSLPATGAGYYANPYGGDATRPDMLPPVAMPPGGPMMPPPGMAGATPADSLNAFAFDPYLGNPRGRCPQVASEVWMRGDWLYWDFRNAPIPPLIVTGNPTQPGAGIPGSGNSRALVGPNRDLGQFHGIRATIGRWLDPDGELGVEVAGFIFAREGTADFFQGSPTQPLSVPVLSTAGRFGVYDFSFPGRFEGSLGIRTASQFLGGEGSLLHRWYSSNNITVDGLFGYRYLWLNERLDLLGRTQSAGAIATFAGGTLPLGTTIATTDSFRARTEFHGVQIGSRIEARHDIIIVTAYGKGGVGINLQTLRAEGNTMAVGPGVARTVVGGIRVLPSNFGRDTNTDFSMFSETGIEFGVQVTKSISVRAGYNLLWWSDVLRPGNVISPVTTLSQVPIDPTFSSAPVANARPVTVFQSSDFFAHGLVVGGVFEW